MSDFQEYPKAIYSAAGKMAIVGSLDAENEQRSIWGEEVPVEVTDLPLDLSNKPVEPASEPVAEPAAEPVPEEPVAAEAPAAEAAQ